MFSSKSLALISLMALLSLGQGFQYNKALDPSEFIQHCLSPDRVACNSFECYSKSLTADLRHMDNLGCAYNSDCLHSSTGMICLKYSNGRSFCECPRAQGFNVTMCACQPAQRCPGAGQDVGGNSNPSTGNPCHNGMECSDEACSCQDLRTSLYESTGKLNG